MNMGQNIILQYIEWHFLDTPRGILRGWSNCLRFNLNYWSVIVLLKTLFSPWRRYQYSYGKGFDLTRYFEAFTFNLFSRFLGAILRSVLIALGLFIEISLFLAGLIIISFWLILPFFVVFGFYFGFRVLF